MTVASFPSLFPARPAPAGLFSEWQLRRPAAAAQQLRLLRVKPSTLPATPPARPAAPLPQLMRAYAPLPSSATQHCAPPQAASEQSQTTIAPQPAQHSARCELLPSPPTQPNRHALKPAHQPPSTDEIPAPSTLQLVRPVLPAHALTASQTAQMPRRPRPKPCRVMP